jgi:hypothetical protein
VAASQPVVSNTTPIINLVGVGLLDLLPGIYGGNHCVHVASDEDTSLGCGPFQDLFVGSVLESNVLRADNI